MKYCRKQSDMIIKHDFVFNNDSTISKQRKQHGQRNNFDGIVFISHYLLTNYIIYIMDQLHNIHNFYNKLTDVVGDLLQKPQTVHQVFKKIRELYGKSTNLILGKFFLYRFVCLRFT